VKTFKTSYPTQPADRRSAFAVTSTATGCAILLLAAAGAVNAQTTDQSAAAKPGDQPEEVIVTGIRKGIQDAISAKKSSSSIIEVVSAEDIGKLPDSSIAESIARLPGIAAQRTNGRAQTLSIRGLGPDFTVTTFNGREQATTNDNRTVEFDQYPSELVTQVKIFKTPNAGMAYQGIAGTTDIETVQPLSYAKSTLSATYRREKDGQTANINGLPNSGDRASLTYINQFMDHTVGVAFGVSFNKTPYQAQTREPWGYNDVAGGKAIAGVKDGIQSSFYERLGYLGVVEFKPNDQLHMTVDAYHSSFKELQTIQRMEMPLAGQDWDGSTTTPGPVVNGRVLTGSVSNVPFLVVENYNNDRHAQLDSLGWNTDFKLNDDWSLNGDLSWSKVKRDDLRLESTAGTGTNNDPNFLPQKETVTWTTETNGVTHVQPTLNYGDYNTVFLTDPGGWGGGPRRSGFLGHPNVSDEIKALRLAAERKLNNGFFNKLTFGANYAEREKSKYTYQSVLYLPGNISHAVVPEAFRTGIANASFFGSATGLISYDALGLYHSGFWQPVDARLDPNAGTGDQISDYTNSWKVKEKLTTAYVKFDIDTHLGNIPVTGNIGVQTLTADQSSQLNLTPGVKGTNGLITASQATFGAKYTDVLPSLNLAFDFANQTKLRFAAAVTEARPRMDDLAGGASYSAIANSAPPILGPDGTTKYWWSRNGGGNPELKPWKANAFDLSLEKYFANKGYISAAVYYKSITSYIFNKSDLVSFAGVLLPDQITASDPTAFTNADASRLGVATVKVNGHGGYIKGFEFTASLPLETIAEPLKGFGFILSAATNSSSIAINGAATAVPGLSTHVINSTLYYEQGGFSARVSNRYRGDFTGEVPAFDATLTLNQVRHESVVDAQVGYEFKQGPVKGLSLNLSGTNLTDAPFVLYNDGTTAYYPIKYQKYGAVYAFSATYKFNL
jgi:iron complex outermembrane receptor protein